MRSSEIRARKAGSDFCSATLASGDKNPIEELGKGMTWKNKKGKEDCAFSSLFFLDYSSITRYSPTMFFSVMKVSQPLFSLKEL